MLYNFNLTLRKFEKFIVKKLLRKLLYWPVYNITEKINAHEKKLNLKVFSTFAKKTIKIAHKAKS